MHPRAVAHDDTPRSLRGEGLIAHTTVPRGSGHCRGKDIRRISFLGQGEPQVSSAAAVDFEVLIVKWEEGAVRRRGESVATATHKGKADKERPRATTALGA